MFGHNSDVGVYGAGFTSSRDFETGADLAIGAPPARRRLWLVAVCVGALLLCLALAPSDALADLNWGTGVEAALPANAGSNPNVFLGSVSCASAGNCAAVGYYVDSAGHSQGLLLSESSGTWGTGVEAALPADANSNPHASLTSVSCASAGNCAAVGTYLDSAGHYQGLLLSESSGTWGTGVEAAPPANAGSDPTATLRSVSCASAGNCAAVGFYTDSAGHSQGLLLSESSGTWGTGVEAALPANAGSDPSVFLGSVSCASAGNCAVVGYLPRQRGPLPGAVAERVLGDVGHRRRGGAARQRGL